MFKQSFSQVTRQNKVETINTDFVVAGGGLAGVCAAISAARAGSNVVLIQDRPVLGGNASSEVRLWALGATSHMGNNNRWSREGGVIDEIMLDNLRQNHQGNPLIFDAILLDKVKSEANITLLLNTAAYQVNKIDDHTIKSIDAFCSQNSTHYQVNASLFCDATGDGLVAFNAGAAFRIGAEAKHEFDEGLAPEEANDDLLGHTLFFYSKRADAPVEYKAPSFAYTQEEIGAIPRCKNLSETDSGCKFWWIEYGGVRDTIYETEDIKWELWKIVYGIWDYIKNSGEFEDVDDLTLEWIGTVPGKRESRRFEGEYMLTQRDIVEQTQFEDAISFGGWAIDIHPAEGVYSNKPACSQFHSKGVYQIPYRCFISRDIHNLYYAGRIISATHMAFGSTRVMITCAHGGQAVGEAAAMCKDLALLPKDILETSNMKTLQNRLNSKGHGLAGIELDLSTNIISNAKISASSTLEITRLPASDEWLNLAQPVAQLLPFNAGKAPTFSFIVNAEKATELTLELRVSDKAFNYTPEVVLKSQTLQLQAGEQSIEFDCSDVNIGEQYGFVTLLGNEAISVQTTDQLLTGTCSVFKKVHKAVSNTGKQEAPANSGIDEFEFWTPERRPKGQNLAMTVTPAIQAYSTESLTNGHLRPWLKANAWVADLTDEQPTLTVKWPTPQEISGIQLYFDTDTDHALETVLMVHPEKRMPYTVQNYRVKLADGSVIAEVTDNYQTINNVAFEKPISADTLIIEFEHPSQQVPASLFSIHCW
ncbi:FAD-binding dehydrogenase [Saccharobesus litoralis]|uniref:FAD-binding dehydrogenase n=1 Tax=Saccharobesus litoralis TaxID=2172099 RepID=A0A2S0VM11_9ALTE|nr:FAD-dependent oxidoreductase [Saccharobesus litoralis]AWB65251.1 FAD-binding dehydrogenase [Saccharobesus litoralis]